MDELMTDSDVSIEWQCVRRHEQRRLDLWRRLSCLRFNDVLCAIGGQPPLARMLTSLHLIICI